MSEKTIKVPNADHPIVIEEARNRVVVTIAGRVVADSRNVLTMREAAYPPVHYIPRADVDMSLLRHSHHATYCPYKGECSYFSFAAGGQHGENAVWTYEAPYPAVAAIRGHLAFYPDRVASISLQPAVEPG